MKLAGLHEVIISVKRVPRSCYPIDPRSVQFRDLSIISLWKTIKMFPVSHKLTETTLFLQEHYHSSQLWWSGCRWWSGVMRRSAEGKLWGHNPLLTNNSRQDGDRDAQTVPNDLARQVTSKGMHFDLLGSCPDLDLTWGQILKLTFQGLKVYDPNQLDESNTMASFSSSCISYQNSPINENRLPGKG